MRKNLIVLCDGTTNSEMDKGPTSIAKILTLFAGSDPEAKIVLYDNELLGRNKDPLITLSPSSLPLDSTKRRQVIIYERGVGTENYSHSYSQALDIHGASSGTAGASAAAAAAAFAPSPAGEAGASGILGALGSAATTALEALSGAYAYTANGIFGVRETLRKTEEAATGSNVVDKILHAYEFIVKEYNPGDDIFPFGFSRGALAARSLVGLIRNVGIIDRHKFGHSVKKTDGGSAWEWDNYPAFKAKLLEAMEEYKKDNGVDSKSAVDFRRAWSYPHAADLDAEVGPTVPPRQLVRFLGVFDTVVALGIQLSGGTIDPMGRNAFHDLKLSSYVGTARHALGIDEQRDNFTLTFWEPNGHPDSEQVWFPGSHGDVGGGYGEAQYDTSIIPQRRESDNRTGISDLVLLWMLGEAEACGLDLSRVNFRGDVAPSELVMKLRPYPMAQTHDSLKHRPSELSNGTYASLGHSRRKMGANPDELVHYTAFYRYVVNGARLPVELAIFINTSPYWLDREAPVSSVLRDLVVDYPVSRPVGAGAATPSVASYAYDAYCALSGEEHVNYTGSHTARLPVNISEVYPAAPAPSAAMAAASAATAASSSAVAPYAASHRFMAAPAAGAGGAAAASAAAGSSSGVGHLRSREQVDGLASAAEAPNAKVIRNDDNTSCQLYPTA